MHRTSTLIAALMLSFGLLATAEYKLVWSDEFNGNKLDTSIWTYENHCAPQNNELQCYTDRTDNVYVKDGYLYVEAKPEDRQNKKYTSGRINTKKSVAWKYGKVEFRAKLPKGDYLWPALWMLPRDYKYGGWAASGEIDIMEARGQNTNQVSNALHYGNTWPNNAHTGSGAMTFANTDFSADFHLFSAIWERDQIQFLVDNKVVSTQNLKRNFFSGRGNNPYTDIRQPFDQPFFLLINVAVGGNFFGANSNSLNVDIAKKWQSPRMVVDYVRVYQDNGSPVVNPVPVPSTAKPTEAPAKTSQKPTDAPKLTDAPAKNTETPKPPKPTDAPKPNTPNPCNGKCGGESCCNDQRMGAVCYQNSLYVCADNGNGKNTLCGKGLGACGAVCYDTKNYKCTNGKITQK